MKIINIKDNASLQDFFNSIKSPSLLRVYSNGCGHCHAMENDWSKLKSLLTSRHSKSPMNIVDIESSYLSKMPDTIKSRVIGFPSMFALKNGKISHEYNDERKSSAMYDFCKRHLLN